MVSNKGFQPQSKPPVHTGGFDLSDQQAVWHRECFEKRSREVYNGDKEALFKNRFLKKARKRHDGRSRDIERERIGAGG